MVVLGHTGFVGGALLRGLKARGLPVSGASSRECNLLEPGQARAFLFALPEGARVVLCSGILRVVRDSYETMLQNVQMVESFADAARGRPLGGIIFLSTADVYGYAPPVPITEETRTAPENYYGLSKMIGEHLLRVNGGLGCPVTVLRLPGIYGPGDGGRSVVGRLLGDMRRSGSVTVHGNGGIRRDYVHVEDVCAVAFSLLESPHDGMLNVATGVSYSILEIVRLLAQYAGLSPEIRRAPRNPQTAGDLVFDVSALRRRVPRVRLRPLEEGLVGYLAGERAGVPVVDSRNPAG